MNKHVKKIVPALSLLLVSVVLVSTATFAWFSMNTTVDASGISLTAVTPVNLLISLEDDAGFSNAVEIDNYTGALLMPSSIDPNSLIFNAVVPGMVGSGGAGGAAENGKTKIMRTSDVGAVADDTNGYYAQYVLYLKTTQHLENNAGVYLSSLEVYDRYVATASDTSVPADTYYASDGTYAPVAAGSDLTAGQTYLIRKLSKASRVALVVTEDAAGDSPVYFYATEGFDAGTKYIVSEFDEVTVFDETRDTTTYSNVFSTYTDAHSFEVNDEAIEVQLLVWIEGQDSNCVNANSGASLDIALSFSVSE